MQSTSVIVDAAAELAAAQTSGAEAHAPFEYTAAEAYLHKAREEQSYAEFEVAVAFGRKSRDCAQVARMLAEGVARANMGSTRPTLKTKARCRPGPEREPPIPDADQEPNARGAKPATDTVAPRRALVGEPKDPGEPQDPAEPADPVEPEDPPARPKKPIPAKPAPEPEPADEPLPEGDAPEQ